MANSRLTLKRVVEAAQAIFLSGVVLKEKKIMPFCLLSPVLKRLRNFWTGRKTLVNQWKNQVHSGHQSQQARQIGIAEKY